MRDAATQEPLHRRVWAMTRRVVEGLFEHHALDHAATMAFYFFLGTIPLLVFVGLLLGAWVQREGAAELAAPLYRVMPRIAADSLRNEMAKIGDTSSHSIAPLSAVGFLWLTSNGVHNLMDVFELLVGARPRSWLRQRVIAVVWVVAGLAVIAALTWVLLQINGAAEDLEGAELPVLLRRLSHFLTTGWHRFGVLVVFLAVTTVGLALFYRTSVVHPRGVRRRAWPGTMVALVLWAIVSWAFGKYVSTIAEYAVYYGSLATVAVILLWLYLTSLSLLVGAEVNALLEGHRGPAVRESGVPSVRAAVE